MATNTGGNRGGNGRSQCGGDLLLELVVREEAADDGGALGAVLGGGEHGSHAGELGHGDSGVGPGWNQAREGAREEKLRGLGF